MAAARHFKILNIVNSILRSGEYSRQKTIKAGGIFMIVQDVGIQFGGGRPAFCHARRSAGPPTWSVSLGSCMVDGKIAAGRAEPGNPQKIACDDS